MAQALLVIDPQKDYFPEGKLTLWNTEATLRNIVTALHATRAKGGAIVLVQHLADATRGPAPFFAEGTTGAAIHTQVRQAAPDAPVVTKRFADSFFQTNLGEVLAELGATDLLVCGMMTQNCVTHTAISKSAEQYGITVLADGCTTVDEMIHNMALRALATRIKVVPVAEAL